MSFVRAFPVRTGFWILLLLVVASYTLLFPAYSIPEATASNTVLLLAQLLLQLGLILLVSALGVGLLSTVLAWYWQRRQSAGELATVVRLQSTTDHRQTYEVQFSGTVVPFWGNRQIQLRFANGETTPPAPLKFRNAFIGWNGPQSAAGTLHLQHIQVYQLQAVRYGFKDVFGLLALYVDVPASKLTFRNPEALDSDAISLPPRQAQELTQRTDTLQRVEGDLYNSRRFGAGDDMRRILWSVYARNRELMVRVPEIFEPYASTLTVQALFSADFPMGLSATSAGGKEALDFYKNAVWTIYERLRHTSSEVQLKLPQQIPVPESLAGEDALRYRVSAQDWIPTEPPPAAKTTLLLVSSLISPQELQTQLEAASGMQKVMLVKLSEAFRSGRRRSVLARLLFRIPGAKARTTERLSRRLFRQQLQEREQTLLEILYRSDALAGVMPVPETTTTDVE